MSSQVKCLVIQGIPKWYDYSSRSHLLPYPPDEHLRTYRSSFEMRRSRRVRFPPCRSAHRNVAPAPCPDSMVNKYCEKKSKSWPVIRDGQYILKIPWCQSWHATCMDIFEIYIIGTFAYTSQIFRQPLINAIFCSTNILCLQCLGLWKFFCACIPEKVLYLTDLCRSYWSPAQNIGFQIRMEYVYPTVESAGMFWLDTSVMKMTKSWRGASSLEWNNEYGPRHKLN